MAGAAPASDARACGAIGTHIRMLLLAAMLVPGISEAQTPVPAGGRLQATRPQLQDLLAAAEQRAASAGSEAEREQARTEAQSLSQRLNNGDLQVGDRVIIDVELYPQLSDTFTVATGRILQLPEVGNVPVEGVLRSELGAHLTTAIGRYFRQPVVRARALVRVEIMGSVSRPGFYLVPADLLLTDALMEAGGPGNESQLDKMRVLRGGRVILSGAALRTAIVEGSTLDQLDLRAGDRIEVPARRARSQLLRDGLVIASGIASVVFLLRSIR